MKDNFIFKCHVCNKQLKRYEKSYKCKNNHTFDVSSDGYVNLLPVNKKNSKIPGDSKEMVTARTEFLNEGYYKKLSDELNLLIHKYMDNRKWISIFDAGCGEGYYLDNLARTFEQNENATFFGVDISKEAVKHAAKRNENYETAVASVFDIPIMSKSVDCIISIFAPFKEDEFERALKDDGILIIVSPGANHLLGLKKELYVDTYLNEENKLVLERFKQIDRVKLEYKINMDNKKDIANLIKMTPYYWNTDINKINEVISTKNELETEIEFLISIFSKKM